MILSAAIAILLIKSTVVVSFPHRLQKVNTTELTVERLMDGVPSGENAIPYQAALFLEFDDELGFCGGSLVSEDFVLTAAHCCFDGDVEVNSHLVVLGAYRIYNPNELGTRRFRSTTRHIHPDWNIDTFHNDVALIELPTSVVFTDKIQPISMPPIEYYSYNFAGYNGEVSGWGKPAEDLDLITPQLRKTNMVVSQPSRCNSFFANLLLGSQMCAESGARSTCQGDNGGPLVVDFRGELYQIGIVSFMSILGCDSRLPSVFTRVTTYGYWIAETANLPLVTLPPLDI